MSVRRRAKKEARARRVTALVAAGGPDGSLLSDAERAQLPIEHALAMQCEALKPLRPLFGDLEVAIWRRAVSRDQQRAGMRPRILLLVQPSAMLTVCGIATRTPLFRREVLERAIFEAPPLAIYLAYEAEERPFIDEDDRRNWRPEIAALIDDVRAQVLDPFRAVGRDHVVMVRGARDEAARVLIDLAGVAPNARNLRHAQTALEYGKRGEEAITELQRSAAIKPLTFPTETGRLSSWEPAMQWFPRRRSAAMSNRPVNATSAILQGLISHRMLEQMLARTDRGGLPYAPLIHDSIVIDTETFRAAPGATPAPPPTTALTEETKP